MTSIVFATATRYLMPLLLLFSVFLLLRGHNEPGGGFVGGLVLSGAFALYMLAHGVDAARNVLLVEPRNLITAGLLVALASVLVGPLFGLARGEVVPLMTGLWSDPAVTAGYALGTPQLFDVGVYLVVGGVILTMIFALGEGD